MPMTESNEDPNREMAESRLMIKIASNLISSLFGGLKSEIKGQAETRGPRVRRGYPTISRLSNVQVSVHGGFAWKL